MVEVLGYGDLVGITIRWASWCRTWLFIVTVEIEGKLADWVESWAGQSKEKKNQ